MKKLLFLSTLAGVGLVSVIACKGLIDGNAMQRPEGPCDIYEAAGTPCATAHSSTRALYASYDGPLYQIMRQSDGKTLDINVVKASTNDPGGYADAAAQDEFCKDTYCWVTILYDQSPYKNHLYQAPRGGFSGPAMGGYNNVPIADWAPVEIMGHKVYGLMITPGMGIRLNDPTGTAVDDQAEGQYWVINGHHYNSGCCFDYGNAETDSRDDGDGTMETTYFGNQPAWYHGDAPGPWIMTDQENNLVGCVNDDPNDKYCEGLESITWRFVTATADGEPHHWRSMGGNAQEGELKVYYDGGRIRNDRNSYDPMRKQGAILLGNGGDNSVGSAGTYYEGAMTKAGTFPTAETQQAIQANVVAAGYKVAAVEVFPSLETARPSNVQTFALGSTQTTTVRFVNNTDAAIEDLVLSVKAPKGWKVAEASKKIGYAVEPGQTVVAEFEVTTDNKPFNGDIVAVAAWGKNKENGHLKVRNIAPVKINEFSITDSFIELYNDCDQDVDISGWTVTEHQANIPYFSNIAVPAGTKIAPKSYYLFGMANSGLAVDAAKGESTIYVRSVEGIKAGDEITIGGEKKTVKAVVAPENPTPAADPMTRRRFAPAGTPTTVWQPLPGGHHMEIPVGSTNIPVPDVSWFKVGQKMAIGYGTTIPAVSNATEKYEVVTVTAVGQPASNGYLAMDAKPGDTNIKVSNVANISVGDKIRLDIASEGHGIEYVTVTKVGTASVRNTLNGPLKEGEDPGTGLDIAEPLKYAHASNMPYCVNGTGISFEPATKYVHYSNEPVLALAFALELDSPLAENHSINDPVVDANSTAGYHGDVKPNQLFGGPALSNAGGNITLRDAKGNIADAVNFGLVTDPWLGEGYMADSGLEQDGNFAATPYPNIRFGMAPTMAIASLSSGRYPDGADKDDNKTDFTAHTSTNLALAANAGDTNIKVGSVQGMKAGSTIVIGGVDAKVQAVGTPGAATILKGASAGAKRIVVSSSMGFVKGQEVLVDGESAIVENVITPRWWSMDRESALELKDGLKKSHAKGNVTGTGVTLAEPLAAPFALGTTIASGRPTPGAANK